MAEESLTLVSLDSKFNSRSREEGSIWYGITILMLKQRSRSSCPITQFNIWDKNSPS